MNNPKSQLNLNPKSKNQEEIDKRIKKATANLRPGMATFGDRPGMKRGIRKTKKRPKLKKYSGVTPFLRPRGQPLAKTPNTRDKTRQFTARIGTALVNMGVDPGLSSAFALKANDTIRRGQTTLKTASGLFMKLSKTASGYSKTIKELIDDVKELGKVSIEELTPKVIELLNKVSFLIEKISKSKRIQFVMNIVANIMAKVVDPILNRYRLSRIDEQFAIDEKKVILLYKIYFKLINKLDNLRLKLESTEFMEPKGPIEKHIKLIRTKIRVIQERITEIDNRFPYLVESVKLIGSNDNSFRMIQDIILNKITKSNDVLKNNYIKVTENPNSFSVSVRVNLQKQIREKFGKITQNEVNRWKAPKDASLNNIVKNILNPPEGMWVSMVERFPEILRVFMKNSVQGNLINETRLLKMKNEVTEPEWKVYQNRVRRALRPSA